MKKAAPFFSELQREVIQGSPREESLLLGGGSGGYSDSRALTFHKSLMKKAAPVKARLDTKYYPRPDHDKAVMKGELRLDRHAYRIPFKLVTGKEAEAVKLLREADEEEQR